jgi:hypothetical protein
VDELREKAELAFTEGETTWWWICQLGCRGVVENVLSGCVVRAVVCGVMLELSCGGILLAHAGKVRPVNHRHDSEHQYETALSAPLFKLPLKTLQRGTQLLLAVTISITNPRKLPNVS